MKIIDLTHTITPDMPVFPGAEQPKLETSSTYTKDGFHETTISIFSHMGTHMDAPAHLFPNGTRLEEFSPSHFLGQGLVIDCRDIKPGEGISLQKIESVRSKADQADFLLFLTGWSQFWGEKSYFGDYPIISREVCQYVIDTNKKGIGLDTIGVDPVADETLMRHRILLQHDMVIIENLTRLADLGDDLFSFIALPLKYQNSDGAPVRAIGLLDEG